MVSSNNVSICGEVTALRCLEDSAGRPVRAYRVAYRIPAGIPLSVTCFAYPGRTALSGKSPSVGDRILARGSLSQHDGKFFTDYRVDLDSVEPGDGLNEGNSVLFSGILGNVVHNSDKSRTATLFLGEDSGCPCVVCTVPDGAPDYIGGVFCQGRRVRVSGWLQEDCCTDIYGYRHLSETVMVTGCDFVHDRKAVRAAMRPDAGDYDLFGY